MINEEVLAKLISGELKPNEVAVCNGCNNLQLVSNYYLYKSGRAQQPCKSCRKDKNNPWAKRLAKTKHLANIRTKYNITSDEYNKLFNEQQGLCKICNLPSKDRRLAIDHCHKTNKIRGLLCTHCNVIIGFIESKTDTWIDQSILLEDILSYLYSHKLSTVSEDISDYLGRTSFGNLPKVYHE